MTQMLHKTDTGLQGGQLALESQESANPGKVSQATPKVEPRAFSTLSEAFPTGMFAAIDANLRTYSIYLSRDMGEDSYHDAVIDALERETRIFDPIGYFRVAIRRKLFANLRRRYTGDKILELIALGCTRPPHLFNGSAKQEMCRKGLHSLTGDNLAKAGASVTCRACKLARQAVWEKQRRKSNVK